MEKIKKGTVVKVENILGKTADELVTRIDKKKYKFNCDAYVIGESCDGGFFNLRQAREIIPDKKLGDNIQKWRSLRQALHEAGLETVHIPGGGYPIHYCDEVVIADYAKYGSHYFVIKHSDIKKYLNKSSLSRKGKKREEKMTEK